MNSSRTILDHFTFRTLLQGMSHPGKIYPLTNLSGAKSAAVMLLGCLMDHEVRFTVIDDPELESVLAHDTGGLRSAPEDADCVIVCNGTTGGRLACFRRGSLEYPDTGATVLYLVAELKEESGGVTLSGPGVAGTAMLRISGLHPDELQLLKSVNSEFPQGVDAIFLDRGGRIACIPRSSRIGVS